MRPAIAYLVLLAEALIFHKKVLFNPRYAFPYDFRDFHYPLYQYLADRFGQGSFPLWDPYTFCGFPFYANLQAQAYYPPTVIAAIVGQWVAPERLLHVFAWQLVLHIFLGGSLAYLLFRRTGLGEPAALAGATVF